MGDGSFAASTLMILQPGGAGNGLLSSDGPAEHFNHQPAASNGTAGPPLQYPSNGNSTHLPYGALQDGVCIQPWQGGAPNQQQQWSAGGSQAADAAAAAAAAAYLKQQQLQQLFLRQQENNNMQQQIPGQLQLGAQMAQLHAQHNYSRSQPGSSLQPPSNGDQAAVQMAKLQQLYAAQQQQLQGRDQQQQQEQELLLVQQQQQALQQQQGGMVAKVQQGPAVSALRQSLFAMQQQQQQTAQPHQQPQNQSQQQQQQVQQLPPQSHTPCSSAAAAAAGVHALSRPFNQQLQQQQQQHRTQGRPTAFIPAVADAATGPQQQQQQQGVKATPDGAPSSNLTVRLTIQLVGTYRKCSSAPGGPGGPAVPQPLPRRILTRPAEGVKNNGWDNESWDLILATQVRGCPVLGTRVFLESWLVGARGWFVDIVVASDVGLGVCGCDWGRGPICGARERGSLGVGEVMRWGE